MTGEVEFQLEPKVFQQVLDGLRKVHVSEKLGVKPGSILRFRSAIKVAGEVKYTGPQFFALVNHVSEKGIVIHVRGERRVIHEAIFEIAASQGCAI